MFETLTFTVDYEKEYKKQLAENCSLEAELHNLKEKTYRQKSPSGVSGHLDTWHHRICGGKTSSAGTVRHGTGRTQGKRGKSASDRHYLRYCRSGKRSMMG